MSFKLKIDTIEARFKLYVKDVLIKFGNMFGLGVPQGAISKDNFLLLKSLTFKWVVSLSTLLLFTFSQI